jgi:hypothetical protein
VSDAGDVDGDGFVDLAVGAPGVDQVFVVRGGPTLPAGRGPHDITAVSYWTVEIYDGFQGMVASKARDVNGDGYGDLLISAPALDGNGAVFVVTAPNPPEARAFTHPADAQMLGVPEGCNGCRLGIFASAARLNGGPDVDFLMGAPAYPGTGGLFLQFDATANLMEKHLLGESLADDFGRVVSILGDVNGDGLEDFAVSAMRRNTADEEAGVVYVFSGQVAFDAAEETIDLEAGLAITGLPIKYSWFGTSIGSYLSASSRGFTALSDTGFD